MTETLPQTDLSPQPIEVTPLSDKLKRFGFYILDTLLDLIIIILIVWIIRGYIASPFRVSGESMLDTLYNNDFIIVNKISYQLDDPQRGDVVVIKPPNNPDVFYVKRIIGLPGDQIEFKYGDVYIINPKYPNGLLLNESAYLLPGNNHKTFLPSRTNKTISVPPNTYFVMGDNRNHSSDSRVWEASHTTESGAIPKENIIGKSWVVVFPQPRIIQHMDYQTDMTFSGQALNLYDF
jgi:signal peptidase I